MGASQTRVATSSAASAAPVRVRRLSDGRRKSGANTSSKQRRRSFSATMARKGILRRLPLAGRKQRMARQAKSRKLWWLPCARRARVDFKADVRVAEFTRTLGGGCTLPGDGTLVTLGLGKFVRASMGRLAPPARLFVARKPIEETAWVPSPLRVTILRRAMGDVRFFREWAWQRGEAIRIRRCREESKANPKDFEFMPSSLAEARDRAERLADHCKLAEAGIGLAACIDKIGEPDKIAVCDKLGIPASAALAKLSRASSLIKPIGGPLGSGRNRRRCSRSLSPSGFDAKRRRTSFGACAAAPAAARGNVGKLCHLCQRPIASTCVGTSCSCLDATKVRQELRA